MACLVYPLVPERPAGQDSRVRIGRERAVVRVANGNTGETGARSPLRNGRALLPVRQDHRIVLRGPWTAGPVLHGREHDLVDRHSVLTHLDPNAPAASFREAQRHPVAIDRTPAVVLPPPIRHAAP